MGIPRAIAVGVVGCFLACGCAASGVGATAGTSAATYVVRPEDTLYAIAWRHDLDYRDLAKWNHLGPDYKLVVGQVLLLRPRPAEPESRSSGGLPAPPLEAPSNWVWPTDRKSAPRSVPGGGILLFGDLGQDVRAAAAGRVVYTGSGLRGYGNLIIVKHAASMLSSYAHNRELLVHEGQDVAAGQVIAHMGVGPHQVSALYFEIRLNGKPVDPLRYVPQKPASISRESHQ